MLYPAPPPPPPPTPFLVAQAAWFALLAPCVSLAVNLFGHRNLTGSPFEIRLLATVCSLIVVVGFIFGVVALFAPKREKTGKGKAIAGICINGLLIAFIILSISRQKDAATGNNAPNPPRKGWFGASTHYQFRR